MKKSKLLIVGLIGLLLAGGLVLAGCDGKTCPGDGQCVVYWTGTGSGVIIKSRTGCGDEDCDVYKIKSATSGYSSDTRCHGGCWK